MISGNAFPSLGGRFRRVYKGAEMLTESGTWSKATALGLEFLAGVDPVDVEVDVVVIGAGESGTKSNNVKAGGSPGKVALKTAALSEIPEEVAYTIGAGGVPVTATGGIASKGGDTWFGDLARALGGCDLGLVHSTTGFPDSYFAPPSMDGPGAGGSTAIAGGPLRNGGGSNFSDPVYALSPSTGIPRKNAPDAFSFGTGGNGASSGSASGTDGGYPGGGGGSCISGTRSGGGGRGGIYLRYYVWELAA